MDRPPDVSFPLDPEAVAQALRRTVAQALEEDLGEAGDVTSAATVPADAVGTGVIVAREAGVLAGVAAIAETFARVDDGVDVDLRASDGDRVEPGAVIARLRGPLRAILTGERTALNIVGHLSGVATATARFVDLLEGTGCVLRDTRKTTPGLRLLEKAAVAAAGGVNHRIGLSDALLVKDNHVAAAGGVAEATRAALDNAHGLPVQIEVDGLDGLDAALEAGATDVLLDNFTPDQARQAVERTAGRARLEASGGITLGTARAYAEAGVDRIATGAVTHSAPGLDVALDLADEAGIR